MTTNGVHIVSPGLYGKLPAHGDFVERGLPTSFIEPWDTWLQECISGSQTHLGDAWLATYLTSPAWEFLISPNLLDKRAWVGIMVPSVDSVGRYFSFTLTSPCTVSHQLPGLFNSLQDWFADLTKAALDGLHRPLDADQLYSRLESCRATIMLPEPLKTGSDGVFRFDQADAGDVDYTEYFCDTQLFSSLGPYSLWRDRGGVASRGGMFAIPGLPDTDQFCNLLNPGWRPMTIVAKVNSHLFNS